VLTQLSVSAAAAGPSIATTNGFTGARQFDQAIGA
jgi:hypothetical protein